MNQIDKENIFRYRKEGYGYKKISSLTGIPISTIKSFCSRNPITLENESSNPHEGFCKYCGISIESLPHHKVKQFCSDACRNAWWSKHPQQRKRKTEYKTKCKFCGKTFNSIRVGSRFCSRKCYDDYRREGIK